MFQKADRLTASPGTKTYGRLSVMAQWKCQIKQLLTLQPQDFTPAPRVYLVLVQLIPRENPGSVSWEAMEHLTKAAFQHRRKMLRSCLKSVWKDPLPYLEAADIDPTLRGENLTINDFKNRSRLFHP